MVSAQNFKGLFREVYESRNILKALVVKNLIGRYKNSILGFTWNFIVPIVMMIVYYVVFNQIRVTEISYFWIFISSALFPFNFMISNFTGGCGCIVNNAGMIKKMYFPREIIVLSQIISSFLIMLMGYVVVLSAIVLMGYGLGSSLLFLPLLLLMMVVFTTGYTFLFSALVVYVRDVQYFLNSISMIFFFMTPMYFRVGDTNGILSTLLWINPFTYYVEAFHQVIYYKMFPETTLIFMCTLLSILFLFLGLVVFRRLKRGFVERL